MDAPPQIFNRNRVRTHRQRASQYFQQYDFLKRRVSMDILERLNDTPHTFETCLDLGTHTGTLALALLSAQPTRHVVTADPSLAMLSHIDTTTIARIVMDMDTLPFAAGCFDLVTSALALHAVNDLPGALIQICRTLRPDGLFLGSLFGAGTLGELRTSLAEAETELCGGASARVAPLPGLQDMASLMQRAGFALPVVDVDQVTVRYTHILDLMKDLRGMGEQAAFSARNRRGLSRRILARAGEIYAERFADSDGRLRASFKIIHLSGWAPAPGQPKPLRPGSANVRLADALKTREVKFDKS